MKRESIMLLTKVTLYVAPQYKAQPTPASLVHTHTPPPRKVY